MASRLFLLLYSTLDSVEATERKAAVAVAVARRGDIGLLEAEVERLLIIRVRATRPIGGLLAGVVQGATIVDISATYKEQRSICYNVGMKDTDGGEWEIKNRRVLEVVKKLDLPLDEVIVFGSGLLDVLGIREGHDVDMIVTPVVYARLKADAGWESFWKFEDLEVCRTAVDGLEVEAVSRIDWVDWYDEKTGFQGLLERADRVDGVNFFSLADLRTGKMIRGLEKDLCDVKLIDEYLAKRG